MNVLLIGSGGREHAIAWKLSNSSKISQLYIAPGNPGTAQFGVNLPLNPENFEQLKQIILEKKITIVIVGPEAPLVAGITDYITSDAQLKNVYVVGPNKIAAQLEGSKAFAKQFMETYNIPTARYKAFTLDHYPDACNFIDKLTPPYVLKADGLAAGKGVIIEPNSEIAKHELKLMLEGRFGKAGNTVVIEEFLSGIELSVFILTDGENYIMLPEAKDYKRVGNSDSGLNTGGMGAVSPVPFATPEFLEKVKTRIIEPTINGLIAEQIHYCGFIFFGLINVDNNPYVIEYNCRMGDPETEVVMPRLKTDLGEILEMMQKGKLNEIDVAFNSEAAVTVMMVSGGYPGEFKKGYPVTIGNTQASLVFYAGTSLENNTLVTSGGRVITVTSLAKTIGEAARISYQTINNISFSDSHFRTDIGYEFI